MKTDRSENLLENTALAILGVAVAKTVGLNYPAFELYLVIFLVISALPVILELVETGIGLIKERLTQ